MRTGTDAGSPFLPLGPGRGMENREGHANIAPTYGELPIPPSIFFYFYLFFKQIRETSSHQFPHMEFKENTPVTFQNCGPDGPDGTVPLRSGVVVWVADEAYLAGCFAGLNHRGMCRHSLDVKVIPRNSHFLFHRWNVFTVDISCSSTNTMLKHSPGENPQATSMYSRFSSLG